MLCVVLVLFAFADDGCAKARAQIIRQFDDFVVAVDLDGALGGVTDDVTIVAPLQMLFELCLGTGVNHPVEIIGQLFEKVRALHCWPSPLRRLKYLVNRSRSCNRARSKRDFTAGTLNPSASAVSSVESPSTSRRMNTVRKLSGSP